MFAVGRSRSERSGYGGRRSRAGQRGRNTERLRGEVMTYRVVVRLPAAHDAELGQLWMAAPAPSQGGRRGSQLS